MLRKKWKSVLSLTSVVCLLTASIFPGLLRSEAAGTPPTFDTVTFSHFNVEDDTYSANDDLGFEGQTEGSLANKTFEGTITFDNDTVNSLNIAGQESGWEGVRLLVAADGLLYFCEAYERFDYVYIDETIAQTTVIGAPVDIKLSFEVADTDNDGDEDDVRFWLYFKNVLYNNAPIMEAVDYAQYLGNYIGGYTSASSASITVASKVPTVIEEPTFDTVTFNNFNVDDGTYSANDDLGFEGQTEGSLANKTFEGTTTFDNDTVNSLNIAGQESGWEGVRILFDGESLCFGEAYERFDYVYIDETIAQTTVIGAPVDIKLSFEVADTDNDGDEDDVRFWLYFKDVLYNESPIMEAVDYAQYLGNYIGGYTSASSASITVASKVPTVIEEPTFDTVTFNNFNVDDGTYSANDDLGFEGETEGSLANKTFEGIITFDNDTVNSLNIAGQESGWEGVRLLFDGESLCFGEAYERFDYVYIDETIAQTTVIGAPVDIKLSFEVADTDNDGDEDDVRFWLYFENVLYNETPIMEAVDYAQYLGNYIGGYTSASSASITVASKVPTVIEGPTFDTVTFNNFNVDDGTYSANDDLGFEGETEGSLANKTFEGIITFDNDTVNSLNIAGQESGWEGVRLLFDGESLCFGEAYERFDYVYIDETIAQTTVIGAPVDIKLSFEVADTDNDGDEDDVRFWLYFKDVLYNESPIMEAVDYAQYLGNYIGGYTSASSASITVASKENQEPNPPITPVVPNAPTFDTVTFADFAIENGTYSYYSDDLCASGYNADGFANKTFTGTITFSENPGISIQFAGKDSAWEGVKLFVDSDGLWFGEAYERLDYVYINEQVMGTPVNIKLSFEVADLDSDGVEDDVRFWLYLNDVLYNNAPIMEAVDYAQYLGNYIGFYIWGEDANVAIKSTVSEEENVEVDFRIFGYNSEWEKAFEADRKGLTSEIHSSSNAAPYTGDNAQVAWYMIVCVITLMGIGMLCFRKKGWNKS